MWDRLRQELARRLSSDPEPAIHRRTLRQKCQAFGDGFEVVVKEPGRRGAPLPILRDGPKTFIVGQPGAWEVYLRAPATAFPGYRNPIVQARPTPSPASCQVQGWLTWCVRRQVQLDVDGRSIGMAPCLSQQFPFVTVCGFLVSKDGQRNSCQPFQFARPSRQAAAGEGPHTRAGRICVTFWERGALRRPPAPALGSAALPSADGRQAPRAQVLSPPPAARAPASCLLCAPRRRPRRRTARRAWPRPLAQPSRRGCGCPGTHMRTASSCAGSSCSRRALPRCSGAASWTPAGQEHRAILQQHLGSPEAQGPADTSPPAA